MTSIDNLQKIWPTGCDVHAGSIREELRARLYEGAEISSSVAEMIRGIERTAEYPEALLWELHKELQNAPPRKDFHFDQPYTLEAIRASRPTRNVRNYVARLDESLILDKLHGGWAMRCAGNTLGIPVESLCSGSTDGIINLEGPRSGRDKMRAHLAERGEWPLADYVYGTTERCADWWLFVPESFRQNLQYAPSDDDTRFTLINLMILENCGAEFSWNDIARFWNSRLPMLQLCTAELQALLNYNMRMGVWLDPEECGRRVTPEFTSGYNNPYREWIGAMNRAEGFGFACAGNPELAAELAWRDAHWTHRANGIYGEMFMASAAAAAFVTSAWNEIVEIASGEIPANCRMAEEIAWMRHMLPASSDFLAWCDVMDRRFDQMPVVHTVPNLIAILSSLYFAGMDPDKSICNAVMAGYDTDSAAATAGAIAGIAAGYQNLGSALIQPLHDLFDSQIMGVERVSFQALAQRHLAQYRLLREKKG